MYLTRFNKEQFKMDDQNEKITLVALQGGIWSHNLCMLKLVRKISHTLKEFMDLVDEYVNAEDIFRAMVGSH